MHCLINAYSKQKKFSAKNQLCDQMKFEIHFSTTKFSRQFSTSKFSKQLAQSQKKQRCEIENTLKMRVKIMKKFSNSIYMIIRSKIQCHYQSEKTSQSLFWI